MKSTKIKSHKKRLTVFEIVLYSVFMILALITIFPIYNVLIVSISNTVATATHSPYILPYVFDLTGYKTIMIDEYFYKSLFTTLFVTIVGTGLNMLFSIMGAYVLSRKRLLGRNIFLSLILFTMFFSGGLIPTYLTVIGYGLGNTVWSMIVPPLVSTYYLIIMKNYFSNLSPELEEASKIDGANDLVVLVKIFLPISAPFMATFALFYAVERWNEWWNAFIYISDRDIQPLQIYLRQTLVAFNNQLTSQAQTALQTQGKISVQSVQMANIVIAMFPIMCVYPFLQKYFVKGVLIGSVKG